MTCKNNLFHTHTGPKCLNLATVFAAFSAERYDNERATSESRAAAIGAGSVLGTKVERREVTEQPPLLYDLNAKKTGNY